MILRTGTTYTDTPGISGIGMGAVMGMGAYPTDPYYDPKRPTWLPYWLDTASEEAMKFGLYPNVSTLADPPRPPAPAAPGAPQTTEQMTVPGTWTTDQAIAAGVDKSKSTWLDFFTKVADQETANQKKRDSSLSTYLPWIVLGGLVYFGVNAGKGR